MAEYRHHHPREVTLPGAAEFVGQGDVGSSSSGAGEVGARPRDDRRRRAGFDESGHDGSADRSGTEHDMVQLVLAVW